jgi:hypothetical protein
MPTVRLRKRLLDRLAKSANSAGELGLALLMTAGVAHCGGSTSTQTGTGQGHADGAADHQSGGGEGGPAIEAPLYNPDAGSDGNPSPLIEAPTPAPDAGLDAPATGAPDAGSDGHPSPWVEAPLVVTT